jgi:hypothetical protein
MKLKLAEGLALPADEAVTQKYGFIGRSGSGKSYGAMRLAELFLGAGAQIIALDWVGIWWSLRLAANGKHPGFQHVYIFGGEHADVELRPESGALMADLVVDKHISVVLDVMHFRKAERTRFATAFAEQFFHRKKTARTACHLFIEEAQAYLPQMVRGEEARMVGVFEDIGKVGRNYGIGNSLISQRPQAINKDVLNQIEVLLAFQTNGPQERKAIAGWTSENTTAGAAMMQELPKLHVGDALVWSPQWLRIAEKVHISKRDTYDASSTPKGEPAKAIKPKTLEPSDLEQLGQEIAATIEKAKADDPKELRRQIAEKNKRISELENLSESTHIMRDKGQPKSVPVLTDADRALLAKLDGQLAVTADYIAGRADETLSSIAARAKAAIDETSQEWVTLAAKLRKEFTDKLDAKGFQKILDKLSAVSPQPLAPSTPFAGRRADSPVRAAVARTHTSGRQGAPATSSNTALAKMHRAMLIALAQHPDGLTKRQILVHTGYASSGPVSKAFAELAREAYVDADGTRLRITANGLSALGPFEPLPLGDDLREWLLSGDKLSTMEKALLSRICEAYPNPIRKGQILEQAGYASSGPVSAAFAKLVAYNYAVPHGASTLKAAEELFS